MAFLLDTNILLRFSEPKEPQYAAIRSAIDKITATGELCVIVPQNLVEFWAVATRPYIANGLQMDEPTALATVKRIRSLFEIKHDNKAVYETWEKLVVRHQVAGRVSYDARLVAAMIVHKIDKLLTLDKYDFLRFTEISAIDPSSI